MNEEIVFERKNRKSKKELILGIIALIMFIALILDGIFEFIPVPEDGYGPIGGLLALIWILFSASWFYFLPHYFFVKSDIVTYKDGIFTVKSVKLENGEYLTFDKKDLVNIIMKYDNNEKLYAVELQFKDNELVATPIISLNDLYTNYEKLWNICDLSENNSLVKKQTYSESMFNTELDLRKSDTEPSSTIKFYCDLEPGYGDVDYDLIIDDNKYKLEYDHMITVKLNNGTHTVKLIKYFMGQTFESESTFNVDSDVIYSFGTGFFNKNKLKLEKVKGNDIKAFKKQKKIRTTIIVIIFIIIYIILSILGGE